MTMTYKERDELNDRMADEVRDAIGRYCADGEAVRDWFDDIMTLVWWANEVAVPKGELPDEDQRKEDTEILWRDKRKAKKVLPELEPRLWRF
jgi:hypothetical protein